MAKLRGGDRLSEPIFFSWLIAPSIDIKHYWSWKQQNADEEG